MKINFFKRKKLNRKPRTRRERLRQKNALDREYYFAFEKVLNNLVNQIDSLNRKLNWAIRELK